MDKGEKTVGSPEATTFNECAALIELEDLRIEEPPQPRTFCRATKCQHYLNLNQTKPMNLNAQLVSSLAKLDDMVVGMVELAGSVIG